MVDFEETLAEPFIIIEKKINFRLEVKKTYPKFLNI